MARGVNKVTIVGNLGDDPDVRYMPSGGAVTTISVATSESWTDKNTNEKQERTEWHRITLFNRLGEVAGEYLRKGSQVYIEGSIRTDKYQDKNTGEDRYSTSIIARDMQLLGGQRENTAQHHQASHTQTQRDQARRPPASRPAPAPAEFDDDIPF